MAVGLASGAVHFFDMKSTRWESSAKTLSPLTSVRAVAHAPYVGFGMCVCGWATARKAQCCCCCFFVIIIAVPHDVGVEPWVADAYVCGWL